MAEQAEQLIRAVDGIADLRAEQLTGLPQLQIAVNRESTARVGFAPGDVIRAVRVGLVGEEESQIWLGQRRFNLVVRLRDDRRDTFDAIRTLLIDGHDGRKIPLGQRADVFVLLLVALGSATEAAMILGTVPIAFVGGILALLMAGETWNVSSLVGLIGLFGIAVQNSLALVTQTRGLLAEARTLQDAVREASIGRVRPKLMTAGIATLGLLPLVVLQLHGTEIERPLAVVTIGGLLTSTLFTLLVLPTFYLQVHGWLERRSRRMMQAET